jgi:tRNA modification GTPase
VVLVTPAGRGAVASLVVEGPAALTAVASAFCPASGRELAAAPLDRIVFGRWGSSTDGEEVVVCRRSAERVEVHCHGGRAAAEAITGSLVDRGCEAIDWRRWIEQSQPDPLAAAAQILLASAATERTAGVLWDQHAGALRHAVEQSMALVSQGNSAGALRAINLLLAMAGVGLHLVEPWRVVLAGPPNVGKSSLINALLGYARAIVHDAPGTTRDVVTAVTALEGWPIELADTAGLRDSDEPLEVTGMALAQSRLAAADLVVLVSDSSLPQGAADAALANAWPAALRVRNKCDLVAMRSEGLWTSATTGEGVAALARAIVDRLVPSTPQPGQAVPFMPGQVERLHLARKALAANELGLAAVSLQRLAPPVDGAC